MLSLYQALISQHSRQLLPVRCAEQTIAQLHRYFEDVVLENSLSALVVESLPTRPERTQRAMEHVMALGRAARHAFFFAAPDDGLQQLPLGRREGAREPVLLPRPSQKGRDEHFVIIADARFSALLVSLRDPRADDGTEDDTGHEVIWTFEPDIVYSALEYLMARVTAERLPQTKEFASAVRSCVPKATSLQLTVSVTTKLARLLQEQAAREVAVNHIASAIRSSLELPSILQTAVNEVGRALGAEHCALRVDGEHEQPPTTKCYFRDGEPSESELDELVNDLNAYHARLSRKHKDFVHDGVQAEEGDGARPVAVVPLVYHLRFTGALMVSSDDAKRVWHDSELLLLRTVAAQVAVAVNHARLYEQQQHLALTDSLTGCVNRRSFEQQLEKDLRHSTRTRRPLSLIMLDIDHFKRVNDSHGHDAGDAALRFLADVLRDELRVVDTAARYGGEEFAVILPETTLEGGLVVAERLRARIESMKIPGVGCITASLGVATFPLHANARAQFVSAADHALYEAKGDGRNRVAPVCAEPREVSDEMFDETSETPHGEAEPRVPTHAS